MSHVHKWERCWRIIIILNKFIYFMILKQKEKVVSLRKEPWSKSTGLESVKGVGEGSLVNVCAGWAIGGYSLKGTK